MELMQAIETRRTVRDFSPRPVPREVIHKALQAGLKAPSYNHLKQWDFILVDNQETRFRLTQTEKMVDNVDGLAESFAEHEELSREMYLDAIPKQRRMIMEAPELLVIVFKPKTQVRDSQKVYDLNCFASVWCCIENILLSLAEDDIFGVIFIPQNTENVKEILNIPAELEVSAILPMGYKAETAKIIPQKQASLEQKLHIDRW